MLKKQVNLHKISDKKLTNNTSPKILTNNLFRLSKSFNNYDNAIILHKKKDPFYRSLLLNKVATLFLRKGKKNISFFFLVKILSIIKKEHKLIPYILFISILYKYRPFFHIGSYSIKKGSSTVNIPIGLRRETQYIFSALYFNTIFKSTTGSLEFKLFSEFSLLINQPDRAKLVEFVNTKLVNLKDLFKNINYK